MCHKQSIVPPHILDAKLRSDDPRLRESALRTMTASVRIRGEREIIGAVRAGFVANAVGH